MASRYSMLIPALIVAVLVAGFLTLRPFSSLTSDVPPLEDLAFESVTLDAGGIHATLRAAGSEPVNIVQVHVDGAFRAFSLSETGGVGHLDRVQMDIPYPWVAGETHAITVLTASGVTFDHEIEVALATAKLDGAGALQLVLIGLFVGFVPILVGFAFLPGLRAFGSAGMDFALALTLALLAFLLVDTLGEAMEFAGQASGALNATSAVFTVAILTFLILLAVGRRGGAAPQGLALAFFIALGIGVHNLGEGIAIGASVAVGEVALASFLVMGFFLHNVSEGIAIAAPLKSTQGRLGMLILLALLAGGPASIGTLTGVFAFTPFRAALAFAVGAGAILQVLFEVGTMMLRRQDGAPPRVQSGPALGGFSVGLVVMYATSLLIAG